MGFFSENKAIIAHVHSWLTAREKLKFLSILQVQRYKKRFEPLNVTKIVHFWECSSKFGSGKKKCERGLGFVSAFLSLVA